jgi:hypothetical protein
MSIEQRLSDLIESCGAEFICLRDGSVFFRENANADGIALPYRHGLSPADVRRALESSVHGKRSTPRKMSAKTRAKIARLRPRGGAVADEFNLTAALAMQIFSEGEQ